MKKYAMLLACLAWAYGTSVQGQSAGGGGGASGGTGGGAVGGTTATPGGTTVAPGGGTGIGGVTTPQPGTGLNTTRPGAVQRPVAPGTGSGAIGGVPGTPAAPATGVGGVGNIPGANSGAIGGVGPGVGGTGGNLPHQTVRAPGATTPAVGPFGTATAPGNASMQRGVTTQPGVGVGETGTGSPADVALSRRVRGQLLNSLGAGATGAGATAGVAGAGLSPQSLANVQINANNGMITLQGTVPTEAERRLIEARLRQTTGVQSVVNNIQVAAPAAAQGTPGAAGTSTGVGAGGTGTPVGGTLPR